MEQLLLHLIGDYLLQSDWMARNKAWNWPAAALHAVVYSLPFLLITNSLAALAVICATHALVDRYRMARFAIFAKNRLMDRTLRWADASATGFGKDVPAGLALGLLIVVDNTIHLTINYAALRWL